MTSHRVAAAAKPLIAGFLVLTLSLTTLHGCAEFRQTMADNPLTAATICAAGGAAAGAGAGAALDKGNRARGAIIGGVTGLLAGGVTCFVIAKASSSAVKDYSHTQSDVKYKPSQGTLVRVENLAVQPLAVPAGEKFTWRSRYVVMTPDQNADLQVAETRIVSAYDEQTRQWKEMGRHRTEVTIKPGTRMDEAEMAMPKEPTARRYLVTFQVQHNQASDQKRQEMSVITRQAWLFPAGNRTVGSRQQEDVFIAMDH